MCPSNTRYNYTPHVLLTEHPRLFIAKCYKMVKYTLHSLTLCSKCYEDRTTDTEYTATFQHIMLDGPNLVGPICHICNKRLFTIQAAVSCDECSNAYMYIATRTRESGNDPRNIRGFLFDILYQQLIRLFVAEDVDV